jgi:hypothetical protein
MLALHCTSSSPFFPRPNSRLRIAILLLITAIAICPVPARAQTEGITVGHAKSYDNQSLTIMLEELNNRLHQIQIIDQTSLAKALGTQQGSQQNDVARGVSISVSPTPPTTAPAPPALPDLIAAPSYQPSYGENAGDLLSDQVDLTYQIFNLRMLLERSITDRLNGHLPRRQAVIGFNITLDPPSNAKDAAAYVEITLSTPSGPIELVAAMPQEKTYNASALSSSSTAFGGSAVAKIVTVGYSQRNRSQTFFLYRDSDTLAIERPSAVANGLTFGWVFRPVLGRRSVSSGMRQMFAVVALPDTDSFTDLNQDASKVIATVKTYWLHYTRSSSTTVLHPGFWDWAANRLPKGSTTSLPPIRVSPTKPVEEDLHPIISSVKLFPTTNGNTVLQIEGDNFFTGTTVTIGDKTYQTAADGLFLKSSQTVILTASSDVLSRSLDGVVNGRYGASAALYRKPTTGITAIPLIRPLDPKFTNLKVKIFNADPAYSLTKTMISGYPAPYVTLNGTTVPYPATIQELPEVDGSTSRQYLLATVTVPNSMLQARDNRVGVIFPLLGTDWHQEGAVYDDTAVQVAQLSGGKDTTFLISKVGTPFTSDWHLVLDKMYDITCPPPATSTDPKKATQTSLTTIVQCTGNPPVVADSYALKLVADTGFLKNYKKLVLITKGGDIQAIDLPASSPAPAAEKPATPPKITKVTPATVGFNEAVTIIITGDGLDAVKQISFDGKPLTFWAVDPKDTGTGNPDSSAAAAPTSDGSDSDSSKKKVIELHVLLSHAATGKEGHQELLLQVDPKTFATATITVSPAPTSVKSDATTEKKPQ